MHPNAMKEPFSFPSGCSSLTSFSRRDRLAGVMAVCCRLGDSTGAALEGLGMQKEGESSLNLVVFGEPRHLSKGDAV